MTEPPNTGTEGPRPNRSTGWTSRIALVLISILLAACFFEIALRFTDESPWYEQMVEEQMGTPISVNRVGKKKFKVRQPLIDPMPKSPDTHRILFLGDSFTYGSGLSDEAATFPSRVIESLNQPDAESPGSEFIHFNGGIPGSLTRRWVALYAESVDRFHPDLVVVVFFLRDGTRQLGSIAGLADIRKSMQRYHEESFLFRHSRLYRLLVEQGKHFEFGDVYFESMRRAYLGTEGETREWQSAQKNLLTIRDNIVKRGGEFILVVFPILFGLDGDYPLQEVVDEIQRFGEENQIPTLSLLPAFEGKNPSDLWVSALDQHPNEQGHAIAAEAITAYLEAEYLARKRED